MDVNSFGWVNGLSLIIWPVQSHCTIIIMRTYVISFPIQITFQQWGGTKSVLDLVYSQESRGHFPGSIIITLYLFHACPHIEQLDTELILIVGICIACSTIHKVCLCQNAVTPQIRAISKKAFEEGVLDFTPCPEMELPFSSASLSKARVLGARLIAYGLLKRTNCSIAYVRK